MSLLPKSVATAAAAALFVVCPVVAAAADAHPATRHTSTHSHGKHADAHGKGSAHRHVRDSVPAGARRGASHAIAAQLKAVNALVTGSASLTIVDAAALHDALVADAAAVDTDLESVGDVGSLRALHTLMANAITTRQLARVQFEAVVAADAAADEAAALNATANTLFAQLVDIDAADGVTALDGAAAKVEDAAAKAAGVAQYVLLLAPDTSRADVHAAEESVEETLTEIAGELSEAQAEIAAIQAQYGF